MRSKKSLGQHWLTSVGAINKIIESANLKIREIVLEIGPGQGVLTKALLDRGVVVIAVEKDRDLIVQLKQKFAREIAVKQLQLVEGDILNFKLTTIYKIVANIPYNITGAIIEKFLTAKNQPRSMTLLVQKEVAERIVAKDSKESILSLSVKVFGTPKYIQTVKAGSFNPPPKVDSAILQITNISRNKFKTSKTTEEKFFRVVKTGFAHKRKTIANNLNWSKLDFDQLGVCGVRPTDRAEDLALDQWFCLARNI